MIKLSVTDVVDKKFEIKGTIGIFSYLVIFTLACFDRFYLNYFIYGLYTFINIILLFVIFGTNIEKNIRKSIDECKDIYKIKNIPMFAPSIFIYCLPSVYMSCLSIYTERYYLLASIMFAYSVSFVYRYFIIRIIRDRENTSAPL